MTDFRTDRWLAIFVLLTISVLDAGAGEPRSDDGEEAPETFKNFLRWSTASEVDNFGYDVYRGESEDGPFERLTAKPILGAGTTDQPSRYEFVDEDIDPYETYYYYVESISMGGVRERFSPIVRKQPKLEKEPPPDDGSESEGDEPEDDPGR